MNNNETNNGLMEAPPQAQEAFATLDRYSQAEYDIQIATAKRYPRSLAQFKIRAREAALIDEDTASSCLYSIPRKDHGVTKFIEGESIRLAEIVAGAYQNLVLGSRVLETDRVNKTVRVVGVAWDLENNVRMMVEKIGRISNKEGKLYSDDMIITTTNATVAKAIRDSIFKVVPKSFVADIKKDIKKLLAGDEKSFKQKRENALNLFKDTYGIDKQVIFDYLGIKGKDDITADHLYNLFGLHNLLQESDPTERKSIIDGMGKPIVQQTAANSTTETKKANI